MAAGSARALRALGVGAAALGAAACALSGAAEPPTAAAPRAAVVSAPQARAQRVAQSELRAFEERRRAGTDFAREWAHDGAFGADPYRLLALPGDGGSRLLGLLHGSSALVLLDGALRERARVTTARRPQGAALGAAGTIFVVSELEPKIRRYTVDKGLSEQAPIAVPDVSGLSAVAAGPNDTLYAASDDGTALFWIEGASSAHARVRRTVPLGRGVRALEYVPGYVVANALLEHTLVVVPVGAGGEPRAASTHRRIVHDGPFWGIALAVRESAANAAGPLLIAATGIEDHALDRTIGSFGYIDSFLYLYEVNAAGEVAQRAQLNTSKHDVVTPKAVTLAVSGANLRVDVAAYGSGAALALEYDGSFALAKLLQHALPPGTAAALTAADGTWFAANPLLDAWLRRSPSGEVAVVPVAEPNDAREPLEKVGEALQYTTLMAPENRADGPLSRFTCEACHFEGYVDGRTHYTGRGSAHATTKPLLGLFNNRPYFSRALDPDLTAMVNNEFHVAGAGSGHSAWFGTRVADAPWLVELGVVTEALTPSELRQALAAHLMRASHAPNVHTLGRQAFDAVEARGARVFRERCESCHQARLETAHADTRAPFEEWERFIFSDADPLVWASTDYVKTGVVPYVHPRGARVPSLRRLHKKYPYFTNGSAASLARVLAEARFSAHGFAHSGALEGSTTLSTREQEALLVFLSLL